MKKFADFICRHPRLVLAIMTLLLLPAFIGYRHTSVNYDILTYLPQDLKSTQ